MIPKVKARRGFTDIHFLGDGETGKYGTFIPWETKEDGEAAEETLLTILRSELSGIAKSPPTLKLFEIIEQKA